MTVLIRDAEADRLVRELAARTGETITQAVKVAAQERLDRLPPPSGGRIDREKLEKLLATFRDRLVDDPRSDDEIIGYDENGLPT